MSDYPKHVSSGLYELSDGRCVEGYRNAKIEQKKIKVMPDDLIEAVEQLRKDNYLVILKAMPQGQPFRIQGSNSEFDNPHPDKFVWEGKCVASVMDMNYRKGTEGRWRKEPLAAGETLMDAMRELWKQIYEE